MEKKSCSFIFLKYRAHTKIKINFKFKSSSAELLLFYAFDSSILQKIYF